MVIGLGRGASWWELWWCDMESVEGRFGHDIGRVNSK